MTHGTGLAAPVSPRMRGPAGVAQLVEHVIRNDGVACSSHAGGTIHFNYLALNPAKIERGAAGDTQGIVGWGKLTQ